MKQNIRCTTAAILAALILASAGTSVAVFSGIGGTVVGAEEATDNLVQKTVSTAEELRNALTGEDTNVEITVANDIELPSCITISGNRKIILHGETSDVTITCRQAVDEMTSDETRSMFYFSAGSNVSMTVQNIVLDGGGVARLFCLGNSIENSEHSLTLNSGAVLQNGHPQLPSNGTGNQPSGGAIRLGSNSRFVMNDGKIINNTADRYGGGIYGWVADAVVEINGGEISGNSGQYAGGIVMLGSSKLYLHGGQIIHNNNGINTTSGGGIFFQDGSMYIGGGVVVRDNTVKGSVSADIYFNNTNVKIYIDAPLTGEVVFKPGFSASLNITAADNYILTASDAAHLKIPNQSAFYLDTENSAIKITADTKAVTFHSNFGEDKTYTQNVPENKASMLTANPFPRVGYILTGWNTEANGSGTAYADKAEIIANEDMTLYAQWKPANYTITLNKNGGTIVGEQDKIQYTYGMGATLPTDVIRPGYTFQGWYDNEAFIGNPVSEITDTDFGDKTYYAKWTPCYVPTPSEPEKPVVAPVQNLTAVKKAATWLKLNFDKVDGADGYEIYNAETNETLADCTTQNGRAVLTKTVTGLQKGTAYKLQVRAYKLVDDERVYGEASQIYTKATAYLDKVTGVRPIKKTQTTLKIQFNKVEGAERYKIFDADTGKVLCTVSTQSGAEVLKKTITGLNAGETRKYKVRAYATINSKNEYGEFSKTLVKATAE